jgi:hypothetical protein
MCIERFAPAALRARPDSLSPHHVMADGISAPPVRAPEFPDTLDWLHTGGRRLTLADFRGKLLLLDFWTYG